MIDPRSTRAYKLEKENRELKKEIELLKVNCNIGYEELKVAWKYKSRCKKAIEYIEKLDKDYDINVYQEDKHWVYVLHLLGADKE